MDHVVGASMKSVQLKLEDLIFEDHTLIQDVRSEVQCINHELAAAQARDRVGHDEDEERWARQMREVAYEAEEFVDHIRLQLIRQPDPRGRGPVSSIRRAWYAISTVATRRAMAAEIGGLRILAQRLGGEGRARYGTDNILHSLASNGEAASTSAHRVAQRAQPAQLLPDVADPVGMEQAMAHLRPWFSGGGQEADELRVLAIVGCGGLGKSTLAEALRHEFAGEFDSSATVLASRCFNLRAFLRSLLKQIMLPFAYAELQLGGSCGWKDQELRDKVEEQLLDKRYIIIIEDIWMESAWENIWRSLPENDRGSRIVVTTSVHSVAQAICRRAQDYVYTLNPLNAADSQCLLQRTLGANHRCLQVTDSAISRILEKCGGLPLAIIAVTSVLAYRMSSDSSPTRACDSIMLDLQKGGEHDDEITKQIFNLCFNDLPAELKTCLLSLSIFPVGYTISLKRLIRRWIVEGFVTEKPGKTMEQVAEDSFGELIKRNLIQPAEISSNGEVKNFQVHDVILENIVSKSTKENFITVVDGYSSEPMQSSSKVRWLSTHSCGKEEIKKMSLLHVRSFTAFGSAKHLPNSLAILQVLDLEGCEDFGTNQLNIICKMYLLKYLSLRRTYIKALPHGIGRLHYLETLDIRETNVPLLPKSAGRLKRMVHLLSGDKIRGISLLFTKEIAEMSQLQTLSGVKIHRISSAALAGMRNLTKLSLYVYNLSINPEFLSYSSSVTSLAIDDGFTGFLDKLVSLSTPFNYLHTLKLSGYLSRVPPWMNSMQCLGDLTLSLTSLKTDALLFLSNLCMLSHLTFSIEPKQHLRVLNILQKNVLESGGEIFIPSCGFHCLHVLRLSGVGLPLLTSLQGAMPSLKRLDMRFKISEGIYGLENLASLQKVHLTVSNQTSEVTKEKLYQIKNSLNKHPKRPTVIYNQYSEW